MRFASIFLMLAIIAGPHPLPAGARPTRPVDRILADLGGYNAEVRRKARTRLDRMEPRDLARHLPAILDLALDSLDNEVRSAASAVLLRAESSTTVQTLMERLLEDECGEVADVAAKALGAIGDTRAVSALTTALADLEVRDTAVESLGLIGSEAQSAVPTLRTYLATDAREEVLIAMGRIGGDRARRAILCDARRGNWVWRVPDALGCIGGPAARAALREGVSHDDPDVREAALLGLADAGDGMVDRVLPDLVHALDHEDSEMRETAAEALGLLGPAAAMLEPDLRRALMSVHACDRRAARRALRSIKGP